MEVTLEQVLVSAVKYIQDNDKEGIRLYFDEIPDSFYVPSLYFPVPYSSTKKVTLATYCITTNIQCWFMERRDYAANARAVRVRDTLLMDGCVVPVVDEKGADTGRKLRVTEPEIKRIDEGIIQLLFSVKEYVSSETTEQQMIQGIEVNYAWEKAVRQYKK